MFFEEAFNDRQCLSEREQTRGIRLQARLPVIIQQIQHAAVGDER